VVWKWHGREVVVAKFKALFLYWCEGNEEYDYKLWSLGRNLKLKQAVYKTPAHIVAGAGGISV